MKLPDEILSTIRVFVATFVGGFLSWMSNNFGIDPDPQWEVALTGAFIAIFTTLYYMAIRLLARRFPWIERFLGIGKSPVLVDAPHRALAVSNTKNLRS